MKEATEPVISRAESALRDGRRLAALQRLATAQVYLQRVAAQIGAPLRWAMGTLELARAFGDISAFPTLLLFDGYGRRVASFYGAPPGSTRRWRRGSSRS